MANEHRNGTIKFSDEVIAVCAANATLKTKGVADLAGDFTNLLSKSILGKELLSKGVKVSQTEEGVIVDVFVIVEYKVNIPSVAWDIQEHVKNEIIEMTEHRHIIPVNLAVSLCEFLLGIPCKLSGVLRRPAGNRIQLPAPRAPRPGAADDPAVFRPHQPFIRFLLRPDGVIAGKGEGRGQCLRMINQLVAVEVATVVPPAFCAA